MPEVLGIEYEGIPFGVAPGAINGTNKELQLEQIKSLARSPASFIAIGVTSRYNEGNGGTVYYHDPLTGETINSEGLPGLGIDGSEDLIEEASLICADLGKVLVVTASTLAGEKASEVLPELMDRIIDAAEASVVIPEANYACPNIVTEGGGRKPLVAHDPEAMLETRAAIVERLGKDFAFSEKLTPYLDQYEHLIPSVSETYSPELLIGNVAVSLFNTKPFETIERDGKPVLRIIANVNGEEVVSHAGGKSGPYMASEIFDLQNRFTALLPDSIAFTAANGVFTGDEVFRRTTGERPAAAALMVSRFREGLRVGRSYGSTASLVAQEYLETLEAHA